MLIYCWTNIVRPEHGALENCTAKHDYLLLHRHRPYVFRRVGRCFVCTQELVFTDTHMHWMGLELDAIEQKSPGLVLNILLYSLSSDPSENCNLFWSRHFSYLILVPYAPNSWCCRLDYHSKLAPHLSQLALNWTDGTKSNSRKFIAAYFIFAHIEMADHFLTPIFRVLNTHIPAIGQIVLYFVAMNDREFTSGWHVRRICTATRVYNCGNVRILHEGGTSAGEAITTRIHFMHGGSREHYNSL